MQNIRPADVVTCDIPITGWPLLYVYIPYILGPTGHSDVSCVFDVGCVGGGMGSDKVIQGWQSNLERSTQTLWGDSPFQILFDDIASPRTPSPTPPIPLLLSLQHTQGIIPGNTCAFHNRLIQLNTTPTESRVTHSMDPHLPLRSSSNSAVCSTQTRLSLSFPWFMSFPKLPQQASSSACHSARASLRTTTHVFCGRAGSNLISDSPPRST